MRFWRMFDVFVGKHYARFNNEFLFKSKPFTNVSYINQYAFEMCTNTHKQAPIEYYSRNRRDARHMPLDAFGIYIRSLVYI